MNEEMSTIHISKLQMLSSQFENLRIGEEENIGLCNGRLKDILNYAYLLGKQYSKEKLDHKTLRSLLE